MEDKLGLLVEMIRDIKADIKDLENNFEILNRSVSGQSAKFDEVYKLRSDVEDLTQFKNKVKGIGAAISVLNAAIVGYFSTKV